MKTRFTLLAAMLLLVLAAGCGTKPTVWQRIIHTDGDELAADIASDGNFLYVAGTVMKPGRADEATWLLQKLDKDGRQVWGQVFPRAENTTTVVGDIAVDANGTTYAAGRSTQEGRSVCLVAKCGPIDGRYLWQKGLAIGDKTAGFGICRLSGSRIAVSGSAGTDVNSDYMVAVLSDKDGQTIWVRNYDLGPADVAQHIASDARDFLAISGQFQNKDNADIITMKLSPQGDTLWTRIYDSGGEDRAGDVAFDRFGNILVTGTAFLGDSTRCVILEYDPDGAVIRKAAYGKDAQAEGHALYVTPEADIFVAGKLLKEDVGLLLAFQYLPNAQSVWERSLAVGRTGSADGIYVSGDVYIAGTVEQKTKDIVVARLARPVAKPTVPVAR